MIRRRCLVLFSLATCLPAAHASDLMDVFHQAVLHDPTLATADATRLAIAEGVPQARAALLPNLSAELDTQQVRGGSGSSVSGSGQVIDNSSGAVTRERDLTGEVTQNILNLADIAALKAAQSSRDAQEQTYRAALQNLYIRVAKAYIQVLIDQDNLEIYKAYEDGYKAEYDISKARNSSGLVADSDVAQSQSYYLYIKSIRIQTEDSLKDDLHAIEEITGAPVVVTKKMRDNIPTDMPVPADPKAWVDLAMSNNPTVMADQYTVDAAEHTVQQQRAGHLPTISASVAYGKAATWTLAQRGGSGAYGPASTTIGITVSVPIFSGGLTQSQVRQALDVRDEDLGNLEADKRSAQRNVYNYYNQVVDGVEALKAAGQAVQVADKSVATMRAGYEMGNQTMTSVVNAIEIQAEAKTQYISLRDNFVLNQLLLKQAAGSIDVHDLEYVNRLLE